MSATTGHALATPTHGSGGSFTIRCSSRIAATPRACLDVVVKSSEYPTWNRFCRKCTIDSQPTNTNNTDIDPANLQLGTQFTFDVHLNPDEPDSNPGQAIALEVSVLEPIDEDSKDSIVASATPANEDRRRGWRIAWRQRPSLLMPAWMLRSERVQEFVEVNGGSETEYHCWETFYGVLAPVVRRVAGKQVERGFDAWQAGLKGRVESGGQGRDA